MFVDIDTEAEAEAEAEAEVMLGVGMEDEPNGSIPPPLCCLMLFCIPSIIGLNIAPPRR